MKKYSYLFSFLLLISIVGSCNRKTDFPVSSHNTDLCQFVDPFIGTGGVGHTMPGATYPLGIVQLGPNTGNGQWKYCSGYQYEDTLLYGFLHTHLNGGGNADLGDVLMLPFSINRTDNDYYSSFSKEMEEASPGYYSTFLTADKIKVELSATERTGIHRYIFQGTGNRKIYISIDRILHSSGGPDAGLTFDSGLVPEDEFRISGKYKSKRRVMREVYFAIQFDHSYIQTKKPDGESRRKFIIDFGDDLDTLQARVAISTVSIESAWDNLRAENAGKSFEKIRENARLEWNNYLSKILVDGPEEQKKLFYTSLYHLFIQPNNIADVNGDYRGADSEIHNSGNGCFYSTLPLWDTFRGAHPLYTIIAPDKNVDFVNSLLGHYDQAGYLPVWALWGKDSKGMIGNHATAVIADACLKGLPGIHREKAFNAIEESLTRNHWHKYDWTIYDKYGYFPSDLVKAEAVSRTLEAAYDDWCAAQLAKELDKPEEYEFFSKRSGNFNNLFDDEAGFFRGKKSDGQWIEPFDPLEITHAGTSNGDYTEGNAWQYLWSVQHDVETLINLLGGKENFTCILDSLFLLEPVIFGRGSTNDVSGLIGQYAHGNEPSHHVIYLYNYVGRYHRTQELVREVLTTMYKPVPAGISGNVDYGQMSAWYVLSSLGFYPVNPASGSFDIGIPSFGNITISPGDREFKIRAENFSSENKYIKSIKLNGRPITNYQIRYEDIMKGGNLIFSMTDQP
jgi:predicted alpha-1,2-mannosidase